MIRLERKSPIVGIAGWLSLVAFVFLLVAQDAQACPELRPENNFCEPCSADMDFAFKDLPPSCSIEEAVQLLQATAGAGISVSFYPDVAKGMELATVGGTETVIHDEPRANYIMVGIGPMKRLFEPGITTAGVTTYVETNYAGLDKTDIKVSLASVDAGGTNRNLVVTVVGANYEVIKTTVGSSTDSGETWTYVARENLTQITTSSSGAGTVTTDFYANGKVLSVQSGLAKTVCNRSRFRRQQRR